MKRAAIVCGGLVAAATFAAPAAAAPEHEVLQAVRRRVGRDRDDDAAGEAGRALHRVGRPGAGRQAPAHRHQRAARRLAGLVDDAVRQGERRLSALDLLVDRSRLPSGAGQVERPSEQHDLGSAARLAGIARDALQLRATNAPRAARPWSRTGRAASCSSRATPPPAATAEAGDDRGVDAAGAGVCPVVHRAAGAAAGAGPGAAAPRALPPRGAASHERARRRPRRRRIRRQRPSGRPPPRPSPIRACMHRCCAAGAAPSPGSVSPGSPTH